MSAFKMLLKAGYSLDEAISKVGRKPDEKEKREILEYLSGVGESVAEIKGEVAYYCEANNGNN